MALNISKKTSPADVDSSAKGDIVVNNGTDIVSLSVGANGQLLMASSSEPSGLKWAGINELPNNYKQVLGENNVQRYYVSNGDQNDAIYWRGTNDGQAAWVNPDTSGFIDVYAYSSSGSSQTTGTWSALVDDNASTSTPSDITIGTQFLTNYGIVIDFTINDYIKPNRISFNSNSGFGGTPTWRVEVSNNSSTGPWTLIGSISVATAADTWYNIDVTTTEFWRYVRLVSTGSGSYASFNEIKVYGDVIPLNPIYTVKPEDNKALLYYDNSNDITVNLKTDGTVENGAIVYIVNLNTGSLSIVSDGPAQVTPSSTILNQYEIAICIHINNGYWVVGKQLPEFAKGELLIGDGISTTLLTPGSDGQVLITDSNEATGVKWDNVNTLIDTPFTSQRIDLTGNLQLTSSNARYLYLDPQGNTYDVVLTDPPSANDFFYIVNRTGNGVIQIKETAAGGVIQLLNSNTPIAQAHWDGVEWEITTFGNI